MHNDNKVIKVGVDAIQQDQDRQWHCLIMDWLSSADFPAQQSDFIARRQEETGLWFLNSPEFTDWVSGTSQTLFCPGIPGAGKTMMAAITVDHLQKTVQTPDVGVAYVYCNYKRQTNQTTSSLLAAMLKQLVQDRPSIAKPLKLRELQSKTGLRLMATSRFIPDIVEVVEEFKGMPKLEVRADDADVKRYVAGQIKRLPGCIRRDDNLQELVQNKIVEAVDGMFLLAGLHVDSLLDKRTKAKVISTLNNLSAGSGALDDAYSKAIARIDGQLREDSALAKTVLSWISYAQRPLTTGELCHAFAVKPEDEELNQDNIYDVEDIVSVCAGLVTVDEESNVIRLVHYTTQDYSNGIRERWNPSAQHDIVSTCLTYLCFKTFRSGSCPSDAEFESRLEQNIFLDYSARYWGGHAATLLVERDDVEADLKDSNGRTPLSLAAWRGDEGVVKLLVERDDVEADSKDHRDWTSLSWAAYGGQEAVVKLLVERDDVEAYSKDSDGGTPLSWAAEQGHEATQLSTRP
ncbi:hypothetical protein BU23DRAFT_580629 [Bimuria novae-zelandiae CBS 107.79]|uniref:Uncharacterized protein n=1 Tax=Bimuria novae-zelandiae CBS 107.79 TaxID=1447943 RepID=A0A6A5V5Y9_9PLEO|nr:hypothetical protein BU23DRAFT_580629 [Bimuria novae-zelandiae CBS 107.79]